MLLLCVLNVTTRILSSQIYVSHGLILCALHIDPWEFLNKVDTTTTIKWALNLGMFTKSSI